MRLLDEPRGTIDWCCDALASRSRFEVAGLAPIDGTGYAELRGLFPASLLAVGENKWCSSGAFRERGAEPLGGWAIHESVRFR